ncbi:MAG: MBL fold metallo-hydrolase, partial [Planctomycetes bacterium]|nr:MBL fold metallo-hydrolase [Planctomycetota bacterium]
PVGVLAWFQRALLGAAARLPGVTVYVAAPSALFFICYYGFWAAVRWGWLAPRLRAPRSDSGQTPGSKVFRAVSGYRLLVVVLLLTSLFLIRPVLARFGRRSQRCYGEVGRGGRLTVTVLDVGHGLATLLRLPNGTTLLYDAGGGSPSYDVGANIIAPALWEVGVPRIDALVLSHYHWDHISGVPALLERFPVRRCFVNRSFGDAPLGEEVLAALKQHGVPVHEIASGDRIALDERVAIRVLNPPRGPVGDLLSANEASVALLIEHGEQRVLLLADITGAWLGRVLDHVDGSVDVLQVPHHGLPDVNLEELIRRTRPTYALISAAAGERQETARATLEQADITTLATWEHGAVTLELEGSQIRCSTYRTGRRPAASDPEDAVLVPEEAEETKQSQPRTDALQRGPLLLGRETSR